MKSRLLSDIDSQRRLPSSSTRATMSPGCVHSRQISASSFNAIGAFERVTLGYFVGKCDHVRIKLNEQVEALALTGNVAPSRATNTRSTRTSW